MKKNLLILSTILACALSAQAKLNVVATLPDFGSLAREIGGDKIDLIVLAKATEDPHFVDARPSFVVSLRNADALIDGGAENSPDERADECHACGGRRPRARQSALHGRSNYCQSDRATHCPIVFRS